MEKKRCKPQTAFVKHGNCIDVLKTLPDNSIDSIVTDPPYELGFMGKSWDSTGIAYNAEVWQECLRVLRPGGHLLSFSGSRTYHRMACAIEDAGFQIRDQIMWVYGSGFPKSTNIAIAIDKKLNKMGNRGKQINMAGIPKDLEGKEVDGYGNPSVTPPHIPISDEAKKAGGWGTALKPAHEPIVMARKPIEGTNADNFMTHGTGGINIDASRVETTDNFDNVKDRTDMTGKLTIHHEGGNLEALHKLKTLGRFPANFIHDGSDEVLELFPDSKGGAYPAKRGQAVNTTFASGQETEGGFRAMGDSGSAARFFYCPKANKNDRNEGLDELPEVLLTGRDAGQDERQVPYKTRSKVVANHHPTVKPTDLMRYLVRLVTPLNGTVLDPFTGSGSTGKASVLEGFSFVGIEQSAEYVEIAKARIAWALDQ